MHDDLRNMTNTHLEDQAMEAWRGMARVLHTYYAALRAEDFHHDAAFALTTMAAEMLLMRTLWPDRGPD